MAQESKVYARIETLIRKKAPIWEKRLGLSHWEITYAFLDSYFGDDGEEDFKITAVTEARPQYYQAKIKFFLPSAARHDDDHLEKVLVHEDVHILLSPEQAILHKTQEREGVHGSVPFESELLTEMVGNVLESATENVTRALWLAYGPA
jgi:hypothetical protein